MVSVLPTHRKSGSAIEICLFPIDTVSLIHINMIFMSVCVVSIVFCLQVNGFQYI